MAFEPRLTAATVIHFAVADMLRQQKLGYAHFPEVVDLAVINTGLGFLQSSFGFVKQVGTFWDSTYWDAVQRPFLDTNALAYANAVAAWIRDDKDPAWAEGLPSDVKKPMRKSLKYLFKTKDSFFHPDSANQNLLQQTQREWLQQAGQSTHSTQIIAIRHLESDSELVQQQEKLLLDKLRSSRPLVLHSIAAVERLKLDSDVVADELRVLIENRDDEIRAKAMIALTKLGQLDELSVEKAANMVDSNVKHVSFAGVVALCTLDVAPEPAIQATERGFVRALQSCDYEFVGLFAAAFNRWMDDPESHFEQLLQDDEPGYLEIAMDALKNVREQTVALKQGA